MSEELKPCPFCGREAKIKAAIKSYGFTIWCACECGAKTEGFCPDTNKEDDTMENIEKCKKRTIEAWNRRANDGKIDRCGIESTKEIIDEQPTAYNPDKVVDQLNDEFRVVRTDEDLEWNRAMDRAITIVKGGGVDG